MKKAFTLVELLVSMMIVTIIMGVVAATYFFNVSLKKSELDYIHFESLCLDIDKIYSKFNENESSWVGYFEEYINGTFNEVNQENIMYFDIDYNPVDQDYEDKIYYLSYKYIDTNDDSINELLINIVKIEGTKYIIQDLNYGVLRNA